MNGFIFEGEIIFMSKLIVNKNKSIYQEKLVKLFIFFITLIYALALVQLVTFAADFDPVQGINNLRDIIASIFQAIGVIVAIIGVVVFGTSIPSHDATQRTTGLLVIAGGIIMAGATAIINAVIN